MTRRSHLGLVIPVLVCSAAMLSACHLTQPTATPISPLLVDTRKPTETPRAAPSPEPSSTPTPLAPAATAVPSPTLAPEASPLTEWRLGPDLPALHDPSSIVALGDVLYVAMRGSKSLAVVDQGQVIAVIPLALSPERLAVSQAAGRIYASGILSKHIEVIEGASVVESWTAPDAVTAVAIYGNALWVATVGGALHQISTNDGTLLSSLDLGVPGGMQALVVDDRTVCAANYQRLLVIDSTSGATLVERELSNYQSLALSLDGRRLYVAARNPSGPNSLISILDATTLETVAQAPGPGDPRDLTIDPTSGDLLLASWSEGRLLRLDGTTLETIGSVAVGELPRGLVTTGGSTDLWTASANDALLRVTLPGGVAPGKVTEVVPLTFFLSDLAIDPQSGLVFAACISCDMIYVLQHEDGVLLGRWPVGRQPSALALLDDGSRLAVLCGGANTLDILDTDSGHTLERWPVSPGSEGLMVTAEGLIFCGDLVLAPDGTALEQLAFQTGHGSTVPPSAVYQDARRGRLFAKAFNGVPGSNGGYVLYPLDGDRDPRRRLPGRLSLTDALYDTTLDRWYCTNTRMGTYGLQIVQAHDNQEIAYLPLAGYPSTMALNTKTGHLWIASMPAATESRDVSQLLGYDTQSITVVASIAVPGSISSMAVDTRRGNVLMASAERGALYVLEDDPERYAVKGASPLATKEPMPTITLAPTPTCSLDTDRSFADLLSDTDIPDLGCPLLAAETGAWAVQPFEHGRMLWQEQGAYVYVLCDDGRYCAYGDAWETAQPELSCEAAAPENMLQPKRGFGLIWCHESLVRERMGWATAQESALAATSQVFARGMAVALSDGQTILLHTGGQWTLVGHPSNP